MCAWWITGNLPHGDVVVDWLCVYYREIDEDAVARRHSDSPHTVLEVWIIGWVSRRVNCAIHGCYIATTESWRGRGEKSDRLDTNFKSVFDSFQVITVDKTNHNCVLLITEKWEGMGGVPVRKNCRGRLLITLNLMTLSGSDTKTLLSYLFRGNVLKFDFEQGVKAKALSSGFKRTVNLYGTIRCPQTKNE